jgi:glyoxylase-like metal-dependent hydrolase (beta-lactamase superfamily II)
VGSLDDVDVELVRADNPSPLTLDGTNTWVVGRDPAWVVDPGPALDTHVSEVATAAAARGGLGGIALTHDHIDHSEAVDALRTLCGGDAEVVHDPAGGTTAGPFAVIAVPGHSPDHVVFVTGGAAFTGDAVLGAGSVFVSEQLGAYLDGLRRLLELDLEVICPGHGPPVWEPRAKLEEYLQHRLDRERRLVEALDEGLRSDDELLDRAWSDAPADLRFFATLSMRAHLGKLLDEGRLPDDFPPIPPPPRF